MAAIAFATEIHATAARPLAATQLLQQSYPVGSLFLVLQITA